ncbi:hypothetical protein CWI38_2475p0010, partial [Hamiltosporidium tvaerminnensis]
MMSSFVFYILSCTVLCTSDSNINTGTDSNDMCKLKKFISLYDKSVYQSFADIHTVPKLAVIEKIGYVSSS